MKDARAHEAALSYLLAQQPRKAMIAHQRALTWVELFDIALQEKLTGDEIAQLADNVAGMLTPPTTLLLLHPAKSVVQMA